MILKFHNFITLSKEEHKNVLEIRNSEYVRNNMKSKEVINIKDHTNWIENLKHDSNNIYYAVFIDNILAGAIYVTDISYQEKTSTWGLYFKQAVNPFVSSLSTYIIIDKIFNEMDINTLNLEVNKLNINAYKFDLNFGFQVYSELNDKSAHYYLMYMEKEMWNDKKSKGLLLRLKKKLEKVSYQFI